jgi:hypothetical protein
MKNSLLVLLLCVRLFAQNITVVFLGILPGGAPEFEKRFTELLREQISVISGVGIADYDDTQYLKKRTDFEDSPVITRSFIEKLIQMTTEKTLVVWGAISQCTIKPVRRWLVGAEAVGTLTLSLTMYSLDFHEYAYIGDIECTARVLKPPVFFRSVDKVTHITASERGDIIAELQDRAARKSVDVINGIIKSQMVKTGVLRPEDVKAEKVSVSDLFDIPTVEAPDVGKEKEEEVVQPKEEEREEESEETGKEGKTEKDKELEEEKEE